MKLEELDLSNVGMEKDGAWKQDNRYLEIDAKRAWNSLPLLEEDAKRRGLEVRKDVPIYAGRVGADFRSMPKDRADISVVLPKMLVRGKVPYGGPELVVSMGISDRGRRKIIVAIYDREFRLGLRDYYHPHAIGDTGYICSTHFTHFMTEMLVERKVQTMIPYAIRVASKGGGEGSHHNIHGVPWCSSCMWWIGDIWDGAYEASKEDTVFHPGAETFSPIFKKKYLEYLRGSDIIASDCPQCKLGNIRSWCPRCLRENVRVCELCNEQICPMHQTTYNGFHYDCYKEREISDEWF